jgi:ABC-type microcin C transport system permease subunit YejB
MRFKAWLSAFNLLTASLKIIFLSIFLTSNCIIDAMFNLTGLPVMGGMFITFYVGTKVNAMKSLKSSI